MANLEGVGLIDTQHIAEALQYRKREEDQADNWSAARLDRAKRSSWRPRESR